MPALPHRTLAWLQRATRWFRWRGVLLVMTFGCGLYAFMMGVGVSDREGVATAGLLEKVYYTLGLFVLGGMDLGIPEGGPAGARFLLWLAYFGAPAITASALVEGVLKIIKPEAWLIRRMKDHIVIAGAGRLSMIYLAELRERFPSKPVIIIERKATANLDEARDTFGAQVVLGDARSEALLKSLRLDRAERVLLLTGDDFVNLDAATKIINLEPALAARTVVHVGHLGFMRAMRRTRVGRLCVPFNSHQITAVHMVETKLADHFVQTAELDTVVLAGFGRFGQTVLDELQTRTQGKFDQVVIVDLKAQIAADAFADEVGFVGDYERKVIDGDISDLAVWNTVDSLIQPDRTQPVFILGSGDDGSNLRVALRLRAKYPTALVVARTFSSSSFAEEVASEAGLYNLAVADLLGECMPEDWFGDADAVGSSRAAVSIARPSAVASRGALASKGESK